MGYKSLLSFFELIEGLRKFSIMIVIVITGIIFRLYNLLDGDQFVKLINGCFIAFVASNTGEHIINVIKGKIKNKISDTK